MIQQVLCHILSLIFYNFVYTKNHKTFPFSCKIILTSAIKFTEIRIFPTRIRNILENKALLINSIHVKYGLLRFLLDVNHV